ncbi:MAG: ferrous iron transporter B [Firmicutes bacterium]|nr:ferrous iron transporter B [Bacillota bacterium]
MGRIVLVGNPNVGKSVVFSQLTGARVVVSNYPGTTVELTRGQMNVRDREYELLDSPGTYSLDPTNRAEEVTANLVGTANVVVNVVDATNLERNLYLTRQLLEKPVPLVVVLNMVDEALSKGVHIDVRSLQELLGVPVIPTVAISGEGLSQLVANLSRAQPGQADPLSPDERWAWIGAVTRKVQKITRRHPTWLEALALASIKPLTGIPLAAAILFFLVKFVSGVGEMIEDLLLNVFFEPVYLPAMYYLSDLLGEGSFLHGLLIGDLHQGQILLEESMGLLTTGVFIVFGIVLPFLVLFYLGLGFLEDCGYLPRLAVMTDRLMHRLGLHGFAIIPMILGLGCNVPAIMSARSLESRRERFLACTLIAITIPCAAQMSMVVGLVARYGTAYLAVIFATLFFIWAVLGLLLDKVLPGYTPSMIMEIPPYRWPHLKSQLQKLQMRLSHFLLEALPFIFLGILIINLFYISGVIKFLAGALSPVVKGLLGLPGEAVSTLLVGVLRKDVAVAMLVPLGLTASQFVTGATVLATYFPCAATFIILYKELGARDLLASVFLMIITSLSAGTMINLLLDTVLPPALLALLLVGLGIMIIVFFGGTSDRREDLAISKSNISTWKRGI